jgi:uncharacterized repeat protein (TIGR01451 family)
MTLDRQLRVALTVATILASATIVTATDTLYGVFWDNTASIEKLVVINPSTGALTAVGTGITNCCFISSGVSTLDPDGDVFYFVGRESTPPDAPMRIYSINLATGAVISNPVLPSGNNYNFIGFDRSPGTLYGVIKDLGTDTEKLVIIDPSTGGLTPVGSGIADCCFIPSGVSSVDPDGNVFYFVGHYDPPASSDNRIFAVDLTTGNLVSDPFLATGFNYNFIGFDPAASTLYGVVYDLAISKEKLVSINTSTGGLTAIGSPIDDCCGVPSGVSTVDPNNGVFYFVGSLTSESDFRIFGLDTTTGAVLSNPTLPANYNHNFIEFDPAAALPQTDLAIAKDDGVTIVTAGESTTYTVTVTNAGPDPATGATVSDIFPPSLTCSWTCVAAGGASCTAGPVPGDISDTVDLPPGGSATYTAVCDVDGGASGTLSNAATVTAPPATNDPVPGNNSDTDTTTVNRPPVAVCQDVTLAAGPECTAVASIDGGSYDPDSDPLSLVQDPPGPYGPGQTMVTLTATDPHGAEGTCQATVTVEDGTTPVVSCNAPATIVPPDAPISFSATATDTCGTASTTITEYDCFKFTKKGKRIDKTGSCVVAISGDTVTIHDSGGVGDHITWLVTATDDSGNTDTVTCEIEVVNPGKGH